MLNSSKSRWQIACALAALFLFVGSASAFHKGTTFRQRTVIRGGYGPFIAPAPFLSSGFVSGQEFAPLVTREFASFAPLQESAFYRVVDSGRDRAISEAAAMIAEAAKKSAGSQPGGAPAVTPPAAPTVACADLIKRMDKIDDRLAALTDKVATIEQKVDYLLAVKAAEDDARRQQALLQKMADMIGTAIAKQNKEFAGVIREQNKTLATLIREALKDPKERDKPTIDDLLRRLEGK
jgi:hypothetical protein